MYVLCLCDSEDGKFEAGVQAAGNVRFRRVASGVAGSGVLANDVVFYGLTIKGRDRKQSRRAQGAREERATKY